MDFNASKCKVTHVGKTSPKKPYYMRGNTSGVVDQEKYLWIIVSSDLNCSQQCLYAYNKANEVLGLIRRTIINKQPRIMTICIKILVRPHVEYSSSTWSPL